MPCTESAAGGELMPRARERCFHHLGSVNLPTSSPSRFCLLLIVLTVRTPALTPSLSISALLYSHYSRRVKNGKTWHLLPRHHRRRRRGLSIRTVWPSYLQTGNEQAQGYAVSRETVAAPGRPVWPRPGE